MARSKHVGERCRQAMNLYAAIRIAAALPRSRVLLLLGGDPLLAESGALGSGALVAASRSFGAGGVLAVKLYRSSAPPAREAAGPT